MRKVRDRKIIDAAGKLFDPEWYCQRYRDVVQDPVRAKAHYERHGIFENRSPNPFFDAEWYILHNKDVAEANVPAILHYLRGGGREGRKCAPFVNEDIYRSRWKQEIAATEFGTVLEDVIQAGDRLESFPFFDRDYYDSQANTHDLAAMDALIHFLKKGLADNRSPHLLIAADALGFNGIHADNYVRFSQLFYDDCPISDLRTHPLTDPVFYKRKHGNAGQHPVVRYLSEWQLKQQWINPLFDGDYYSRVFMDKDDKHDPFSHFLANHRENGANPNSYFDIASYYENYSHLLGEDQHPISHYLENGTELWLEPGESFGQRFYLTRNKSLIEMGEPALVHFLHSGAEASQVALPPKPFLDATAGMSSDQLFDEIALAIEARPRATKPTVSVIIPVYQNLLFTLRCVLSCLTSSDKISFEIIIADDKSPDHSGTELYKRLDPLDSITVVLNDSNLGFLKSCNNAAQYASGDYIMFLNNDTVVLDGWLTELVATFERTPEVGIAGSKLLYPNGLLQEAGGIIWQEGECANYGRLDDPAAPAYNYERDADYISGAAILVDKCIWQEVEGFSEAFAPAYYEDTDLAMKVRAAGYRVIYQPASVVVHFEGITSGTDTASGIKKYQEINKKTFAKSWESALQQNGLKGDFSTRVVDRKPKARILIFDAELPRPDKDSGSITAFYYTKLLVELGYRVTFVPENLQWLGRYANDMQRLGVEVITSPYIDNAREFVLENGSEFDLFVLSRATTGGEFFPVLKAKFPEKPIVFDTVDIHHLRLERQFELAGDEGILEEARRLKDVELSAIRKADATIVVSSHEVDYLRSEIGPFSHATIPLIYEPYEPQSMFSEREKIVFIGGYRHPPNIDAVKYLVEDIWPQFREFETGAKLHIVGSHMPADFYEYAESDIVIDGFVEDLEAYMESARLTVAPLRYGAGVKGKVGNSLRLGVPVVGTSIAGEGMGLRHEEHLLIADGAIRLASEMARLYSDSKLWERLSINGRESVEKLFGEGRAKVTLEKLCNSMLR